MQRSRTRLFRLEETVNKKLEEGREKQKKLLKKQRRAAEYHSICLAAIVLSGEPKVDEPLICAWRRTLKHYEIDIPNCGELSGQVAAAEQLNWRICPGRDGKTCFTEVFKTTPGWLIPYARLGLDACFLDFRLPPAWAYEKWGSCGLQEARRWPELPRGTMGAGDPISKNDLRLIELGLLGAATLFRTEGAQRFFPSASKLVINEDLFDEAVRQRREGK
jgi:hypothetical protein